jgi:hypothetical protein
MSNPYDTTNPYGFGLLGMLGETDTERRKRIAWSNATTIPSCEDRVDCDGRVIRWSEYGKTTECGWEIDHITPTAFGGLDVGSNLRARHWFGNRRAGGLLSGLPKASVGGGLLAGLFHKSS